MATVTITRGNTLPDSSGKSDFHDLVDLASGTVTGIVNADISGSAAIADTKLATITTQGKVNLTALVITSQDQGDIIYASSTTVLARLAKGTAGQVLTMNAGATAPEWATIAVASQSDMEAASNNTSTVTPLAMNWHPGVAKAWGSVAYSGGTPTLSTNHNITSISDDGTGNLGVTIATDFSTANYVVVASADYDGSGGTQPTTVSVRSRAAGTFTLRMDNDAGTDQDPGFLTFACFGDQA